MNKKPVRNHTFVQKFAEDAKDKLTVIEQSFGNERVVHSKETPGLENFYEMLHVVNHLTKDQKIIDGMLNFEGGARTRCSERPWNTDEHTR